MSLPSEILDLISTADAKLEEASAADTHRQETQAALSQAQTDDDSAAQAQSAAWDAEREAAYAVLDALAAYYRLSQTSVSSAMKKAAPARR